MLLQQIKTYAFAHKIIVVVVIVVVCIGGLWGYRKITSTTGETRYSLAAVTKGTLITSVSGSGQVSTANEVAITPKVSGEVIAVSVKLGQEVKKGTLLVALDSRSAQTAVRNAQTDLETAKLELDKILAPVDELTLLQAENSLIELKESKQKAEDNLVKSYEDGFNIIVSVFSDLPTVMAELEDILYSNAIDRDLDNIDSYVNLIRAKDSTDWLQAKQYRENAISSYQVARIAYNASLQDYKLINRYSDGAAIKKIINETSDTAKKLSDAVKDMDNLISFVKDYLAQYNYAVPTTVTTHKTSINSVASEASSLVSSILSAQTNIKSYQDSIISATRAIQEQELSLVKTKAGSDELTIRAKRIAIQQKQDALVSAQETLANYYIRAPFDGVIAKVSVEKGDTASSGTSLVTLVTNQEIAGISLNEVDVASVKVGQKVTLTFDAISDLIITGEVADVDAIGSVSSGVVSYGVKITFDIQDDRVKSGMSVSATIITDTKQDVLLVPSTALKIQNGSNYVLLPDTNENLTSVVATSNNGVVLKNATVKQSVTIGLSNDTLTEIISGLKEGDYVVVKTIISSPLSSSTSKSSSAASSGNLFNIGAGRPSER